MKKFTVLLVTGMLVSMHAAAEIYKCTDASGETHYGDKPCKGESSIFTPRASPKVDENVERRREKERRLLRAYREEHAEEKQNAAELKAEKEKREENCRGAKFRYRKITEARRIYRYDENGEHVIFTDEERASAIAKEKAAVEQWCD